ncbi:MAG TPA: 16S rRNA (adenine(1518)-N(6)/adenine(1519)-N(6))-dimethyltransferase RsmA [Phycisphaerales bacterium]|nr:16S rRNA (adenine(1518)-N(6)/adenine(1519)-N(6))-dimethyltransferase RsmA [Phycisphaerales bacterium]
MQTLSEIRALLDSRALRPKHRLGQNFLHDHNQLKKLIDAACVKPGDVVLEVGPGTGTLTETLLEAGAEVIACELDADMAEIIRERLGANTHVVLIEGDCLEDERRLNAEIVKAIDGRTFKLVANLPYQAASPLMATLLMNHANCAGQWVTIQKEVADRIAAKPGSKDFGTMTVLMQTMGEVELIATVKPASFWPIPKVTSAMVRIAPKKHGVADPERFARFVTGIFSKRRKQIGTILGADAVRSAGIESKLRPEVLESDQFVVLWNTVNSNVRN